MRHLKILASHPVPYHVPVFRSLVAQGLSIDVGYYHHGAAERRFWGPGFGLEFAWDVDLLSGYPHRFFYDGPACYSPREQIVVARRCLPWALQDARCPLLLMGWFAEVVWLVWLLRVMSDAPILLLAETNRLSFQAAPKPWSRVALLRTLLSNTSAVLWIGNRNRSFMAEMGVPEAKLFSAPYSVDNDRLSIQKKQLSPRRLELRRCYGLDPDRPAFLFCGKLIPKKRPLELLEAYLASGLKDRAQLIYVGDGTLRDRIKQRASEAAARHVHLLGFFNQSEMPRAYAIADVLCLPSDARETWGLVVNEALACGLPVIVSDACGCAPDLMGPDNGWSIPCDDGDTLRQTLADAFQRRSEWPAMGRAGRQKVADHTFGSLAQGIKKALSSIRQTIPLSGLTGDSSINSRPTANAVEQ